jgi:hypothetical protein
MDWLKRNNKTCPMCRDIIENGRIFWDHIMTNWSKYESELISNAIERTYNRLCVEKIHNNANAKLPRPVLFELQVDAIMGELKCYHEFEDLYYDYIDMIANLCFCMYCSGLLMKQ